MRPRHARLNSFTISLNLRLLFASLKQVDELLDRDSCRLRFFTKCLLGHRSDENRLLLLAQQLLLLSVAVRKFGTRGQRCACQVRLEVHVDEYLLQDGVHQLGILAIERIQCTRKDFDKMAR